MTRPVRRVCRACGAYLASDNQDSRCGPCQRRAPELVLEAPGMPDEFWEQPELQDAFAERHFGRVLLAYRKLQQPELTQALLGQWLGLTQGQVSRVERSRVPMHDLDKLDRWSRSLHIPQHCLWFTLAAQPPDTFDASSDLPTLEEGVEDDEGSDVRRRDLLKTAGVVAAAGTGWLADTPWQRLSDSVLRGRTVDRTTVQLVEDRTVEFFADEETRPARVILAAIQSHTQTLNALLANTNQQALRDRLLISMGESDALLGWMFFDLGRMQEAVRAWQRTLSVAQETGDGALAACALGYWSYLAAGSGDSKSAIRMLQKAESLVAGPSAPATRSWIAVRLAEEAARSGDNTSALRSLDRALTAFDFASPRTERPWTGFFTASRLGSSTVSTYTQLKHHEAEPAAKSLLDSLSFTDNKVRGLILAELATAAAHGRDFERAEDLSIDAIRVANRTEASFAKKRLQDLALALPDNTGPAGHLRTTITSGLSASRQ